MPLVPMEVLDWWQQETRARNQERSTPGWERRDLSGLDFRSMALAWPGTGLA